MIPDYTPSPARSIVSAGQFVGSESDRATFLRKLAEVRDVPEHVKPEPAPGALRYATPKVIANPRPAVQPGPTRVRKARILSLDNAEVQRLHNEGKLPREIAECLNCHKDTIYDRLAAMGIAHNKPINKRNTVRAARKNALMNGAEEIISRRKAGELTKDIADSMKRHRETVRLILVRAAETDAELAAVLAIRTYQGRQTNHPDGECKRGHPAEESHVRIKKSGRKSKECKACHRDNARESY